MRLSPGAVIDAVEGRVTGGASCVTFTGYHTDSRTVQTGGLFFALKGATDDGHRFVGDAVRRGAAGLVVDREVEAPPTVAVVRVADTWEALYRLAAWVLARVNPAVVGVTGSNGKTSTKEMTAAVLSARHRVLKSEGNLNTETGLPLTLLRLEPGHTAAVLEMGMQGPGEIARLADLARPRVGIVTCIGWVHAEHFADGLEGIARAKAELLQALPPDGLAVVNADDPCFDRLRSLSAAPALGFGLAAGDLRGEDYSVGPDGGCSMTVQGGAAVDGLCPAVARGADAPLQQGVPVRISLGGRHQARNALAALAAGRFLGVPLEEGAARLGEVEVAHRLQPRPAAGGYVVVDDAYNASPESMLAAFESLAERPRRGRLLALLGEMRELGPLAAEAHRRVGERARAVFDRVAVVDVGHGRHLAEAAGAELVPDRTAAAAWVRGNAGLGDLVLVKASHGVALYDVVEELVR